MAAKKDFPLIEVLLVIAIISILVGVVVLATSPNKELGNTRNAVRKYEVSSILNAISQYGINNQGNIPSGISTTPKDICVTGATNCKGLVDLSVLTLNGKYLLSIPEDPQTGTSIDTHYKVVQNANGQVTVSAPDAEQGEIISATTQS